MNLSFLNSKPGKIILYLLRLLITGYILWRIAARIELSEVWRSLLSLPWWLVVFLLFSTLVRHWGQYRNWSYALQLNPSYQPHKREMLASYLIGLPLRFVIPGGSASAGKILFVNNSSRWASLFSFGAERAFLTWCTWTYAFGAALFFYAGIPLWLRILVFVLCLTAPLWAYWLMGLNERTRTLQTNYARFAPRMVVIQLSIAFLSYLQYWLILRQMLPLGFWQSTIRMALTQFSNSIPITVAGLGLRESFAIHFLSGAGFSASQAVSATLSLFFFQDILPALPGIGILLKVQKGV